ncbi:DUF5590 domain-containing protein [Ureibacillus sp. FSL K6-8385]|uniref:Cell wall elongation regulator TseB-like domain-containing protein n=1 Tax=Ureibacillus terrenus TaxID=118246 RepID=A0A540V6K9_9BACL|nr:DUF5590 domain-containing protein [Ureibacillus terrenus]MED3660657.1 DUF5590 domain-containing protein [Ureibacillus terrenus]MED3762777.1 DUF5590 domain-containing protein [Ureibacillus terrenus]TQE92351.1 hypothetical protein FKZ59_01185 [Ureibacillus terrenus]
MKNWIIFITSFVLILTIGISVLVLWKASSPFKSIEKEATELAISSNIIQKASEAYVYNGNKPYVTVFGVDEKGDKLAVFVPITLDEKAIQYVRLEDGISEKEALAELDQKDVKEVLHTKLGYEEPGAVWEIAYINHSDKLNYVYVLFEDGQWWKRILNL